MTVAKNSDLSISILASILFLLLHPGRCTAQEQGSVAYAMACRVEVERDASLSASLIADVQQRIQHVFSAILGSDQTVRFVTGRESAELPAIDEASADALGRQWVRSERLLFVRVGRAGNQFVLRARE